MSNFLKRSLSYSYFWNNELNLDKHTDVGSDDGQYRVDFVAVMESTIFILFTDATASRILRVACVG